MNGEIRRVLVAAPTVTRSAAPFAGLSLAQQATFPPLCATQCVSTPMPCCHTRLRMYSRAAEGAAGGQRRRQKRPLHRRRVVPRRRLFLPCLCTLIKNAPHTFSRSIVILPLAALKPRPCMHACGAVLARPPANGLPRPSCRPLDTPALMKPTRAASGPPLRSGRGVWGAARPPPTHYLSPPF